MGLDMRIPFGHIFLVLGGVLTAYEWQRSIGTP